MSRGLEVRQIRKFELTPEQENREKSFNGKTCFNDKCLRNSSNSDILAIHKCVGLSTHWFSCYRLTPVGAKSSCCTHSKVSRKYPLDRESPVPMTTVGG